MSALFLQLVLAHLIGDFVLQPAFWVAQKKALKIKSKYLYWHCGIHLLLSLVLTRFDAGYFLALVLLAISHFAIDIGKLYWDKKGSALWFFLDQALHLAMIALVVYVFYPYLIDWNYLYTPKLLWLLLCLLLATYVASVVLKVVLTRWNVSARAAGSSNNAGQYIGILERLFVFFFAATGFWEGIGFLLAAKSIFRFGDLKDSNDIKLTEYILIGTLLSFGIGIGCALLYTKGAGIFL